MQYKVPNPGAMDVRAKESGDMRDLIAERFAGAYEATGARSGIWVGGVRPWMSGGQSNSFEKTKAQHAKLAPCGLGDSAGSLFPFTFCDQDI